MATSHPKSQSKPKPQPRPTSEKEPSGSGTRTFFEGLADRGYELILKGELGTLRFDLSRGSGLERWYITVADGNVTVSHGRSRADTMVKVDGELFDRIAQGTANAMTAQLRGVLGQLELLDIPGRWGRIEAFGRGRVTSYPTKRRRAGSR